MRHSLFFCLTLYCTGLFSTISEAQSVNSYEQKVRGMLMGSFIGDAAGGPYEFVWPLSRNSWSTNSEKLTKVMLPQIASAFKMTPYREPLEPYGAWIDDAPKGSVTDDTRLKLIFINSLGRKKEISTKRFAQHLIDYPSTVKPEYRLLAQQWLEQFIPSALYVTGKKKDPRAKPPQTIWAGVPTNLGQMTFLPIAAIHPNQPELSYKESWEVDYFDFGYGRDMHASIIAGLSHAFNDTATWAGIKHVMQETDPFDMNSIPWAKRRTAYWIKYAEDIADQSDGNVARLFEILEHEMHVIEWWDAWIPLVMMISIGELTDYDPIATIQLAIEFGYDTDSYAQLIGAFMGALHGPEIFPEDMQKAVTSQLKEQLNEDFEALVSRLMGK
ncbi:MAG: ADP-ribosylglycohydrolase family protein [Bacteroidota bacterium]